MTQRVCVVRRVAIAALAGALATAVFSQSCTAFDDVPRPGALADAAVDSSAASADAGLTGLLPFDEAIVACSRIVGCQVLALALTTNFRIPLNGASYSYCVTHLTSTFEPNRPGKEVVRSTLRKIIAAKGSCQDRLDEVEHEEVIPGAVQCAGPEASSTGRCLDPETAVYCNSQGGSGIVDHCGKPAGTSTERCATYDGGAECARVGECGLQCTDGVFSASVDRGGGLHHCIDTDCNALGLNCLVEPATGNAGCSNGDRVKGAFRQAGGFCQGDAYVARAFFFEGLLDCATLGARCVSPNDGRDLALCAPTDAACSPFDADVDVCGEGSRINLCVGGRRVAFDCASAGLACLPPLPDHVGSTCR